MGAGGGGGGKTGRSCMIPSVSKVGYHPIKSFDTNPTTASAV